MHGNAKIGINSTFAKKLDAAGWGLFFLWVGTAMLMDVGWNWSILGIGLIVMGVQFALLAGGYKVDIFMLALGTLLIGSAALDAASLNWTIFPLALVVFGAVILLSVFASAKIMKPR